MIYQNQALWKNHKSNLQLKTDGQIILCLPGLDYVQDSFQKRVDIINKSNQTKITAQQLRNRFEDTLLTVLTLNTKIKVLIFPFTSFYRQFKSQSDQRKQKTKCTPYQFTKKVHGNMRIGVSVPWNQVDHFLQQYKQNPQFKTIKIINFNIQTENLAQKLPLMRRIVQETFKQTGPYRNQYHINLYMKLFAYNEKKGQIKWTHQLAAIREQLLMYNYPLQFTSISTVLPNIPNLKLTQTAQYYSELCKKYFPAALQSINETFYSKLDKIQLTPEDLKDDLPLKEVFSFYQLANKLNENMATGNPTLKNVQTSGIRLPQCLLTYCLKQFGLKYDDARHFRSLLDTYGFTQTNLAAQGLFKNE